MAQRTIEVSDLVIALERRIEERGISDAQAARELDVSPQSLSQWKRGGRIQLDRNRALQRRLAMFLSVSPTEVLALHGFDVSPDPVTALDLGDLGGYLTPMAA